MLCRTWYMLLLGQFCLFVTVSKLLKISALSESNGLIINLPDHSRLRYILLVLLPFFFFCFFLF